MVCFTPLELDLFTLSNCPDSKVPRDIWLVSMLIGMVFISAAIITAVMIICYCTHCRTFGVVYSTCVNTKLYVCTMYAKFFGQNRVDDTGHTMDVEIAMMNM